MAEVFQRLLGLETEYAIRSSSDLATSRRSKFRLYESLVAALHRRVPTVAAKHFKEGVFTANGGAVWFEAERPAAGGGLIEGATPECRSPREAVTYQRAQDRLLAEAAADRDFQLLKNDRDACDNVYGAQENYEATFASGVRLLLWRVGLVCLFPLALVTWLGIGLCVIGTLSYFLIAAVVYLPLKLLTGGRESVALLLFGRDLVEGRETCIHVPVWLESSLQLVTRIITAPLALALYGLLQVTAFRPARTALVPFLISRPIFAGAGMVDADGKFRIADKAPAINCVVGYGGMIGDRPIFSMGHFFKAVYADSWFAPREYFELFAARQRLQISLGDSNMCETAEYLRVSTTLLVLDAIEAGIFQRPPSVRRPIQVLHDVCSDVSLTYEFSLCDGQAVTALQVQRYYLAGCRAFLNQQSDVPAEAWDALQLWNRTLGHLEQLDTEQLDTGKEPADTLVGSIDWVTKKYLLERAGESANWAERKKIDLRYHELSEDGYFAMLQSAGLAPRLIAEEAIERATRLAPSNSPATMRGHYIREFADGEEPVTANWKTVVIGHRWGAKTIRLSAYGRSTPRSRRSTAARRPRGTSYRDRH
ncbi:MAG TPA: proteasome accessory factor PafA2 family protein [Pirellulaceae bacterium]|nr:proteasome accessory factor PafA2 family protein [Pirellulaceae bacterium]